MPTLRLTAAAGLAMLALQAGPLAAQDAAATAALAKVEADYEALMRASDPITAGFEGDRAAQARWPDNSQAQEDRLLAEVKALRARLAAIDPKGLADDDRLDHVFLARVFDRSIEAARYEDGALSLDNEGGAAGWVGYIAGSTRIGDRQDAEAWLSRMAGIASFYEQVTDQHRRGLKAGIAQPRSVIESSLKVLKAELAVPVDQDLTLKPFATLPATIPTSEQAELRARARRILTEQIVPARRKYLRFVETEYLPSVRPGLGVGSLAPGRDYYAFRARAFTTTDLTPDQIHDIGQAEVRRIRARMDEVMKEAGWTGDFPSFLNHLRTDPKFYAKTRQELLEKASEIAKRADDKMPSLFRTLPRLPYGVRPTDRAIEEQTTTGRYHPGSLQNGVAGGYIVNTSRLDQRPLYELPALTVHEAVPGHHHQIALAQELGDQPYWRRNTDVTAFTEGWGLYSEFLGEEMGIYRNAYEKFGRLSYEMWRACRLVADTGIHWKGWTIEQARACFRDNSALAPHNIETELQRYVGWPGQALAYKIGELKLKELRARAEQRLGDRFSVRDFHDAVLLGGPLPLDLLEGRVNAWIETQAAAPR